MLGSPDFDAFRKGLSKFKRCLSTVATDELSARGSTNSPPLLKYQREMSTNNKTSMAQSATMLSNSTGNATKKVSDDGASTIYLPTEDQVNFPASSVSIIDVRNIVLDSNICALREKKGTKMSKLKQ